jgi:undecaprenyl-diphosphatase
MEVLSTLQKYDPLLFGKLFRQGKRRRMAIPLARAISRSGDGYLHLLVPLFLWVPGSAAIGPFAVLLTLALAVERALYWLLKKSLKRRRPQNAVPGFRSLIVASDEFSFPSGHPSAAFLLAPTLFIVYGGPVLAMYICAGTVGLSRVLLGVHFPGDILAGAVIGCGAALFCTSQLGML